MRRSMINALIRGQFWKSYPKVVEVRCTKKKLFCRGRSSPSIIVIEREQCERVCVGCSGWGMRCYRIYCLDDTILPQICIYESLLSHLDDSLAIVIAKQIPAGWNGSSELQPAGSLAKFQPIPPIPADSSRFQQISADSSRLTFLFRIPAGWNSYSEFHLCLLLESLLRTPADWNLSSEF